MYLHKYVYPSPGVHQCTMPTALLMKGNHPVDTVF